MTHTETEVRTEPVPFVDMQIAPANSTRTNRDDRAFVVEWPRLGDVLDSHVEGSVIRECAHRHFLADGTVG